MEPAEFDKRVAELATDARNASPPERKMRRLGPEFQGPGPHDVICARGKFALTHPGNLRFRRLVTDNLEKYAMSSSKYEKTLIVSQIIDDVRQLSPHGGFVKEENGEWFDVGDHVAREKCGQAFRDSLHTKYKSSTKAKLERRQKLRWLEGKGSPETERKTVLKTEDSIDKQSDVAFQTANAQNYRRTSFPPDLFAFDHMPGQRLNSLCQRQISQDHEPPNPLAFRHPTMQTPPRRSQVPPALLLQQQLLQQRRYSRPVTSDDMDLHFSAPPSYLARWTAVSHPPARGRASFQSNHCLPDFSTCPSPSGSLPGWYPSIQHDYADRNSNIQTPTALLTNNAIRNDQLEERVDTSALLSPAFASMDRGLSGRLPRGMPFPYNQEHGQQQPLRQRHRRQYQQQLQQQRQLVSHPQHQTYDSGLPSLATASQLLHRPPTVVKQVTGEASVTNNTCVDDPWGDGPPVHGFDDTEEPASMS